MSHPSLNVASHLARMAAEHPAQVAIYTPRRPVAHDGLTPHRAITFRELNDDADAIAHGLAAVGIVRGTRTALMVPPSVDFFALTFGLFKLGAVPVLIDPGMGVRNLGTCLAEAEPEAFVGIAKAHAARRVLGWARKTVRLTVNVGRWRLFCSTSLRRVRKVGRAHGPYPIPDPGTDETAAILFTSGSTGVAKGVVYTHAIFAAQVELLKALYGIQPGEVDLCTFPLFALFGPALGMTCVIPDMNPSRPAQLDPRKAVAQIRQFGVTNLFGSPAVIRRMGETPTPSPDRAPPPPKGRGEQEPSRAADGSGAIRGPTPPAPLPAGRGEKEERGADGAAPTDSAREGSCSTLPVGRGAGGVGSSLPTLRRVISAGAPASAASLERFSTLLPDSAEVFTPYGATEALPVANIGSREILGETRHRTDQGRGVCVGRPVAGMQVQVIRITDEPIAEWSDALLAPPGEVGEFVVRGPVVTRTYYNRPDATAKAKIRDPRTGEVLHRMGDVGYLDEQGRLWFCGRKSHRVVTPSGTLFTDMVEPIFNTVPGVARTALVGVTRNGVTHPVLCVELAERMPPPIVSQWPAVRHWPDIRQYMTERASGHPGTRSVRTFLLHPGPFPVDVRHNSKIFREKLAVWADKRLGPKWNPEAQA